MEWIAQIEATIQVLPDDWRRTRHTLKLTPSTTIEDIEKWALNTGNGDFSCGIELLVVNSPAPSKQ